MKTSLNLEHEVLDKEWVLLIQTAKMMGLSVEEVRLYISNSLALAQRVKQNESEIIRDNIAAHATT